MRPQHVSCLLSAFVSIVCVFCFSVISVSLLYIRWTLARDMDRVQAAWNEQYNNSASQCVHLQWGHSCKGGKNKKCRTGLRFLEVHILTGNIIKLVRAKLQFDIQCVFQMNM